MNTHSLIACVSTGQSVPTGCDATGCVEERQRKNSGGGSRRVHRGVREAPARAAVVRAKDALAGDGGVEAGGVVRVGDQVGRLAGQTGDGRE